MSKNVDNSEKLKYDGIIRTYIRIVTMKGEMIMTDNEKELIQIIRENDNPKQAIEIAIHLMIDFLAKREVPQDTSSARHRESA